MNARTLAMGGAEPGMMLHNAYGYGLFTGGLGLHDGGERLGLTVVPVSGGMTERQLTLIEDLRPEVISCTPSYALTLAHAFAERGVAPDEISLGSLSWGPSPGRRPCAGRSMRASAFAARISSALRGHRARRRLRVRRGALGLARERGPLPSGDRRPGVGRALPEGEEGVLVHDVDEAGASTRPLLDGRHPHRRPPRARAAARSSAWVRSSDGATTCSSSVASTSTRARSARFSAGSRSYRLISGLSCGGSERSTRSRSWQNRAGKYSSRSRTSASAS